MVGRLINPSRTITFFGIFPNSFLISLLFTVIGDLLGGLDLFN